MNSNDNRYINGRGKYQSLYESYKENEVILDRYVKLNLFLQAYNQYYWQEKGVTDSEESESLGSTDSSESEEPKDRPLAKGETYLEFVNIADYFDETTILKYAGEYTLSVIYKYIISQNEVPADAQKEDDEFAAHLFRNKDLDQAMEYVMDAMIFDVLFKTNPSPTKKEIRKYMQKRKEEITSAYLQEREEIQEFLAYAKTNIIHLARIAPFDLGVDYNRAKNIFLMNTWAVDKEYDNRQIASTGTKRKAEKNTNNSITQRLVCEACGGTESGEWCQKKNAKDVSDGVYCSPICFSFDLYLE